MAFNRLITASFLLSTLALGSACFVEPHGHNPDSMTEPSSSGPSSGYVGGTTAPRTVPIAQGQTLTAEPGAGVGVYVEYAGKGQWLIHTTCDTKISGLECAFDIYVTPKNGNLSSAKIVSNNTKGAVIFKPAGAILQLDTKNGSDVISLTTDPASTQLEIEALLDGTADPRLIYWVGPEVIHTGAPSSPVIFDPTPP